MATVALVAMVPDVEALMEEALREEGYGVHALPLHGDTVASLGKLRLDAVLVDGHPFTDLPAFLGALREQQGTAHLPAVVVTATPRKDLDRFDRVEQVEMPFDLADFLGAIRRAADAGSRRR